MTFHARATPGRGSAVQATPGGGTAVQARPGRGTAVPAARLRRLLVTAVAAVAVAGCAKAPAPGPSPAPAPAKSGPSVAPAPPSTLPIDVSANRVGPKYVYVTKQKHGRKVYVLRADGEHGHYFGADTGRSTFSNPHVTFTTSDGKRIVADAPTGTIVEKDKTVLMSGGVRARMADGTTLRSRTLRYDDETDRLHGEGDVVVTSPQGEELQGATLDWNLRDGSIDVAGAH